MEPLDGAVPESPPADPEEWTDEQWLHWLTATDVDAPGTDEPSHPVTPIGRLTRSAGGQVLGQAMVGMARAIYGRDDAIVIVAAGDSEPNTDEPFTVHLDPDHPERSSVVFRSAPDPHG